MSEFVLYVNPEQFSAFKAASKANGLDIDAFADGNPEPIGFCGYPTKRRYYDDEPGMKPPIKVRVVVEEMGQ